MEFRADYIRGKPSTIWSRIFCLPLRHLKKVMIKIYSPLLNTGVKPGFLNQGCSRAVCWGR